ncbi:MAG: hypothetical protein IPG63_17545 [Xanthomonadales bacterium]|nr:hypothetical protein [Xanthomonadales bacterium]
MPDAFARQHLLPGLRGGYVKRLYGGGFGAPAAGIDLIEPGTESPPSSGSVAYTAGDSLSVSAGAGAHARLGDAAMAARWRRIRAPPAAARVFNQATATSATHAAPARDRHHRHLPTSIAGGDIFTRDWTISISASIGLIFANGFE